MCSNEWWGCDIHCQCCLFCQLWVTVLRNIPVLNLANIHANCRYLPLMAMTVWLNRPSIIQVLDLTFLAWKEVCTHASCPNGKGRMHHTRMQHSKGHFKTTKQENLSHFRKESDLPKSIQKHSLPTRGWQPGFKWDVCSLVKQRKNLYQWWTLTQAAAFPFDGGALLLHTPV